jgi:CheY-like chemotaxis protein
MHLFWRGKLQGRVWSPGADLKMPRKDGFDVLQRLRERKMARPKVIVLSTFSLPEDI